MNKRPITWRHILGMFLAFALIAAACGEDDADDSAALAQAQAETAAAQAEADAAAADAAAAAADAAAAAAAAAAAEAALDAAMAEAEGAVDPEVVAQLEADLAAAQEAEAAAAAEADAAAAAAAAAAAEADEATAAAAAEADAAAEAEAALEAAMEVAPGVVAATGAVELLNVLPNSIGINEPIDGEIPTGKRIVYIPINVPSATELIQFLQEGAAELGWEAELVSGGLVPEEFKAAFAQVLRDGPDAVFSAGIPSVVVTEELEGFRDAGIPVVFLSTAPRGVQYGDLVLANIYDHAPQKISGMHNANWVIADSGGEATIVYYDFSAVETVAEVALGFEETIAANCPNCTIEKIDVPGGDIGTNLPGQIVSYLRSNPDTNYIAVAFSDFAIGVPGALADAGISTDEVKLIGANPGPGNRVNIAAGNYERAAVSFPKQENMWRVLDLLARHFTGNSIDPSTNAPYPFFMFTTENVDVWGGAAEDEWPIVPDYQAQYLALWGRG